MEPTTDIILGIITMSLVIVACFYFIFISKNVMESETEKWEAEIEEKIR
jgi:hypothetical protein